MSGWSHVNVAEGLRLAARAVEALEHLAKRPEYRWVRADEKLNAVKALYDRIPHTDHGSHVEGICISCELRKALEGR